MAIAFVAPAAQADDDCKFKVSFEIDKSDPLDTSAHPELVFKGLTISTETCQAELTDGARVRFASGAFVIVGKLSDVTPALGSARVKQQDLDRTSYAIDDVTPFPTTGQLTIGAVDHEASVVGKYFQAQRGRDAHSFSLGPAMSADSDGATDAATALRLQYKYEYASGLGTKQKAALSAAVSIDTTNRSSPDYIDDNSVSFKIRGGDYRAGEVFARVQFYGEALYARAVHSNASNADASAGVEFRMPFARSVSLFRRGTGEFIAPPLSVALSYGYRWHDAPDQKADDGGVFKGSALYHFYLFGKFRVDLQYDYTHNDFSDPSTTDPQTQRMYRGTIAYLVKDRFQVKTSYEDGSIGPVLTKIKQYFIGVAFSDGF